MSFYQPGQFIMYGNFGVCEVKAIGPMSFSDSRPKEYYTLRPLYAGSNDRIYVPTSTDTFMRPILKPEEAVSSLESMKAADVSIFCSRNQAALMTHYQDMLHSNDLLDRMKLFKELSRKEALQKRHGKKLNATDMHFYKLTEQLISEEFALAMDETPAEMRTTLHRAALS